MKTKSHFSLIFTTAFILFVFLSVNSSAQLNWEKYEYPVLEGVPNAWNKGVWCPVVIHEDNLFEMWYTGNNGQANTRQIGYVASLDGIYWWDINEPPVIPGGSPSAWDHHKYPGTVLTIDGTLRMWWWGSTNSSDNGSIGYAWVEENDWQVFPDPILEPGEPGEWDDLMITDPSVYYDGTTYHMYYSGISNTTSNFNIGYATSEDGINWDKYPDNPVITAGEPGRWDDTWRISDGLVFYNDTLRMFYSGWDGDSGDPWQGIICVGYAWSTDYITWNIETQSEPAEKVGNPGSWDDLWVFSPSVIVDDDHLKMWYTGWDGSTHLKIGYADGDSVVSVGLADKSDLPEDVLRISPNPFSNRATLSYALQEKTVVSLDIYNCSGQLVAQLENEVREQGKHKVVFNGRKLQPGIYFCMLKTSEGVQTKKMIKR